MAQTSKSKLLDAERRYNNSRHYSYGFRRKDKLIKLTERHWTCGLSAPNRSTSQTRVRPSEQTFARDGENSGYIRQGGKVRNYTLPGVIESP